MNKQTKKDLVICWIIFIICTLARLIEYFFIRTDETILAENVLHKAFGIVLLVLVLAIRKLSWREIGFIKEGMAENLLKGLLLGMGCFTIAYAVEYLIQSMTNAPVGFAFYVSGFSLAGEMEEHTGLIFVLICIFFNIINVWMEEGIFRGLFSRILESGSYLKNMLFIAFLFGIWHLVMPLRDYMEGRSSFAAFLGMGIGYIILAGIMSMKWSLLYTMTGSLWMGIGDHLFNNVIVTNLLHVVANGEADSLQIVRILIGQLISFTIVLLVYRKRIIKKKI